MSRLRSAPGPLIALGLVLALVVSGFVGYRIGGATSRPGESSVDAGFARDMQTHHHQAVQLSLIIRDRTEDPTIRAIAYDIATSQQQQAGQMFAWLVLWGLPQTGTDQTMAWMNSAGHGAHATPTGGTREEMNKRMGMATPEQIATLEKASGVEAEKQFLTLMIAHHTGGVEMAKAALAGAQRPEVITLARAIDEAQTAEIVRLKELLAERS